MALQDLPGGFSIAFFEYLDPDLGWMQVRCLILSR